MIDHLCVKDNNNGGQQALFHRLRHPLHRRFPVAPDLHQRYVITDRCPFLLISPAAWMQSHILIKRNVDTDDMVLCCRLRSGWLAAAEAEGPALRFTVVRTRSDVVDLHRMVQQAGLHWRWLHTSYLLLWS